MKNQIVYRLLLLSVLTGVVSCKKDFLNVAGVTSPLYRENYVRDLNSMEEYLNGVYLEFNINWSGVLYYYNGYPEFAADNLKPANPNDINILSKYNWVQNPLTGQDPTYISTSNMSFDWRGDYRVIRASSFVIEDIDKYRKENPSKADYIKGQALFFRAIMHFKLVNVFAQPYGFTHDAGHPGVPYITTSNLSAPYSRQSVKEVYDGIVGDLNNAIALMGNTSVSDVRYVGLDAAKALLARVYLFENDHINALNLAKEICVKYPLMKIENGYPNSLFEHTTNGNSEVIFHATPGNDQNITYFLGRFLREGSMWLYATNDVANILNESKSDIRTTWVGSKDGNWTVTKFPSSVAGIHSLPDADYYDPVIRSSEMFLTVAESAFKTGDENTAREYLNAIRKRADPSVAIITLGGDQLINAIYKERRKELCFENFRLFDLQRLGMSINRVDVVPGSPTTLTYPNNKAIAPIPQKDVNIAGLKQNEGY